MSQISREELWRQLKLGVLDPVYVLSGPETYLRDRAAAEIVRHAFSASDLRDFNETEFSLLTKENIESAIAAARALPMMSSRRVVKVTDIRVAATAARDTLKEEYEKLLGEYLAAPTESSVLILIADELNGNRKLTRLLRAKAVEVCFVRLAGAELSAWIRRSVSEAGSQIDDACVRYLIDIVGTDLRRLNNEVQKLTTASIPKNVIDRQLIEALAFNSIDLENFALTSALIAGRGRTALSVLKTILDAGAEPVALLGLISYGFRRLLIAKEMMARGNDRRSVTGMLRLRGRDEEHFLAAARRADIKKLRGVFDRLKRADLAIKTSVGGPSPRGARLQIEMLVCELARIMAEGVRPDQSQARG